MPTLLLMLCLLACGPESLKKALDTFLDQRVETVFDAVGYPDRKESFGSDTVYYWGADQADADAQSCTFKIAAGADGLVKKTSVYGNDACYQWSSMVKKHAKAK